MQLVFIELLQSKQPISMLASTGCNRLNLEGALALSFRLVFFAR
jgi:hypothetical protein